MKQLLAIAVALGSAGPLQAQDLRENEFFKTLAGEWTGTGEMENADQEATPISNAIRCEFSDSGEQFTIEGSLVIDQTTVSYRWEYSVHHIEGLYRAIYSDLTNDYTAGFDASIDEAALKATLTQISNSVGTRMELTKEIVDGHYQVSFKFIESSGTETLIGKIVFDKRS